jgi:hypothetical protein
MNKWRKGAKDGLPEGKNMQMDGLEFGLKNRGKGRRHTKMRFGWIDLDWGWRI